VFSTLSGERNFGKNKIEKILDGWEVEIFGVFILCGIRGIFYAWKLVSCIFLLVLHLHERGKKKYFSKSAKCQIYHMN
jgi:hypothetical protein